VKLSPVRTLMIIAVVLAWLERKRLEEELWVFEKNTCQVSYISKNTNSRRNIIKENCTAKQMKANRDYGVR